MAKLVRHTNLEALKSEPVTPLANAKEKERLMSEFEAFLKLLQSKASIKKKNQSINGQ